MYDVTILNFGEAARVFYDVNRTPVYVDVGAVHECTLDDATARFLFEGQRGDTICMIRQHTELPEKLRVMFSLIKRVMTDPYEEILSEANQIVGAARFATPRPTRIQIREVLGKAARVMCAQIAPNIATPTLAPMNPAAENFADIADADLIEGVTGDDDDAEEGDEEPEVPAKRSRAKINSPVKSKSKARVSARKVKKRAKSR